MLVERQKGPLSYNSAFLSFHESTSSFSCRFWCKHLMLAPETNIAKYGVSSPTKHYCFHHALCTCQHTAGKSQARIGFAAMHQARVTFTSLPYSWALLNQQMIKPLFSKHHIHLKNSFPSSRHTAQVPSLPGAALLSGFRQGRSYRELSKSTTGHNCEEPSFFIKFSTASWQVKASFSPKACISSCPGEYLTILCWYCVKKSCMVCWFNNGFGTGDGMSYSVYHRSHPTQVGTLTGGTADF